MTTSRFATVASDLRERIALGGVSVSGSLESEAQLCLHYGVSRPTVRRALELLRTEGLVESRHGAGWFVTGSAFHQRLAIGTFRHAGSAVSEAGKTAHRRIVDLVFRTPPPDVATALSVPPTAEVLHARSVRTVDGDGLDVAREWVPGTLAGAVSRDAAASPGIWEALTRTGHRIVSVRQTITAGLASDADAQLLGIAEGIALLLVRRIAIDARGIPLALSDHRYVAHRFALDVEFHSGPSTASPEPPGLRAVASPIKEKTA